MSGGGVWKNYGPVLVFVPVIFGIHWGWMELQNKLVPEEQRMKEQPIVRVSIIISEYCI